MPTFTDLHNSNPATALTGAEFFGADQGGQTVGVTGVQIAALVNSAPAIATQVAAATAQATIATTQAGIASTQAGLAATQVSLATAQASIAAAAVLGLPYFPMLNASTAAGGANVLPQGIISGTVGGTAITGATPGTYALTPTGGSFTGVAANLVVASATTASIVIVTPGRTAVASPTAPTFANPAGATIPAGTTLTAVIGTQIASGTGQIYLTTDVAGANLLYWQNLGTGVPVAVVGGGLQVSAPTSATLAAFKARSAAKPGPSRQVWVDANGYAMAIINKTQINHPDINAIRVNAAAGAAAALPKPRIRIASNHGGWNAIGVSQSNGTTQLTGTDRLAFTVGGAVRAPRFILANGYEDSTGQLNPNGNALSLAMVLEQAPQLGSVSVGSVTATPISSGGKSTHVIGDGEIVISEPTPYGPMVPGNLYYYRIYKSVASGQKWPLTLSSASRSWNPGGATLKTTDVVYGSSGTGADATASYGATTQNFVTTAYAFAPIAIVAEQVSLFATTLVTGDSISGGTGSTIGQGYIGAALDAVSGTYVNCGVAGVSLQNLSLFGRVPQYVAQYVDHVAIHCLTNDLYLGSVPTLASAQALILKAAQAFFRPDGKLWFCAILPRTTSTDTWATYANQATNTSVPSGATLTIEQLRVTINNNMRDTTATGLTAYLIVNGIPAARIGGIIDGAALIEHNPDGSLVFLGANSQQTLGTGGYYLINATTDGIHPNGSGVTALIPSVPTTALTSIPVN